MLDVLILLVVLLHFGAWAWSQKKEPEEVAAPNIAEVVKEEVRAQLRLVTRERVNHPQLSPEERKAVLAYVLAHPGTGFRAAREAVKEGGVRGSN